MLPSVKEDLEGKKTPQTLLMGMYNHFEKLFDSLSK